MANEPITGLPYQEANSLQTDFLQNEQLNYFAAWFGTVVQTVGDTTPPGSPVNGHCYIIGASATGAWAGKDKYLTVYRDGWQFYAPKEGARVSNLDDGKLYVYMAGAWSEYTIPASATADNVSYDNTASSLTATDVQAAIDEVAAAVLGGGVTSVNGATGAVVLDSADIKDTVSALTNSAGTVTVDCSLGKSFTLTLAANVTTLTLTNLAGAGYATEIEIEIKQDGTGGWTFALPAAFKALGGSDTAIAAAANAVTVLSAKTFDNGTTWRYAMQESA